METFPLRFRVATASDVATACQILTEATDWEESKGFPAPWPRPFPPESLLAASAGGDLFLVEDPAGSPVGTITLQWADVRFWGERPPDAGYVHRFAIRRNYGGQGIGRQMIEWAGVRTKERGRFKLRLDCLTASKPLHEYYRSLGFRRVGKVIQGGFPCTLFEKSL
ncbi:MAG: GNAT family N-acetyltransferase [Thermoplasmata archaeon]